MSCLSTLSALEITNVLTRCWSKQLTAAHIGGPTRFVVNLVAKAHSRIRRAGEANR